jgi:MoaA/NifB/PqqE/SkfB family radical SAM enzyme
MLKTAYLEVGNKCFCRCKMCEAHLTERIEIGELDFVTRIDKLSQVFERIRLAGNDPLTHPRVLDMVRYLRDRKLYTQIVTTLLATNTNSLSAAVECDHLKVSMPGLFHKYDEIIGLARWSLFNKNIHKVCELRYANGLPGVIFNYTFVKENNYTMEDAEDLIGFIQGLTYHTKVEFFPALYYDQDWQPFEILEIIRFLKYVSHYIPIDFPGFTTYRARYCDLNTDNLYVKCNGDVYTCCMAGGEIGQEPVEELRIGNIDTDTIQYLTSPARGRDVDNYICDMCTPKYYKQAIGRRIDEFRKQDTDLGTDVSESEAIES